MHRNFMLKCLLFTLIGLAGIALTAQTTLTQGEQSGIYIGEMQVQPSVIETATQKGKQLVLKRLAQSLDTQFIAALSGPAVA